MPRSLEQEMIKVLERSEEGRRAIPAVQSHFEKLQAEKAIRRREQNRLAQAAHRRRLGSLSAAIPITPDVKKEKSPPNPPKEKYILTCCCSNGIKPTGGGRSAGRSDDGSEQGQCGGLHPPSPKAR